MRVLDCPLVYDMEVGIDHITLRAVHVAQLVGEGVGRKELYARAHVILAQDERVELIVEFDTFK
ncbi:hypothetical protein D3C72_2292110 [compost metagenome]